MKRDAVRGRIRILRSQLYVRPVLVNEGVATVFLPDLVAGYVEVGVEVRGDDAVRAIVPDVAAVGRLHRLRSFKPQVSLRWRRGCAETFCVFLWLLVIHVPVGQLFFLHCATVIDGNRVKP